MKIVRAVVFSLIAGLLLAPRAVSRSENEEPRPLDLGTQENVKVRLVTVDVVVLDDQERAIPDLTIDDFEIEVDGQPTKVDTLDMTCPLGFTDSPRAGQLAHWIEPKVAEPAAAGQTAIGSLPRRVVLVFDYLHLPLIPCPFPTDGGACMAHTQVLKLFKRILPKLPEGNEEIMVAVLDGALRIEQTFTRDRTEVLDALSRMDKDVTLYAGHFAHSTEKPLFNGLQVLVNLLDVVPGSKAVVLFTGGSGPGDFYDPQFRTLTDQASLARVVFYPIDCQGLTGKPFR